MKYYCSNLAPDDLHWEIGVVRERVLKEPDSKEYLERLAELNAMSADSASVGTEK